MRRLSAILLAASLSLVAAPSLGAADGEALRLLGADPLVVKGVGFGPGERVRIVVRSGETKTVKRVRASRAGSFRARFGGGLAYDPCNEALRIRATGAAGSRAAVKLPQRLCPVGL